MENIFKLFERKSQQIKELRLLVDNGDTGIYKLYTKWPGSPDLDDYMRIIFQNDPSKPDALDFDGGPMISIGYYLDESNVIEDIYEDKHTKEFLVKVKHLKDKK